MAYGNAKQGWYKIINIDKFIKPKDDYMKSFNESTGTIEYKSSLELKAFRYADSNPQVKKYSVEPFNIPYVSPKDNKIHRYFIDMFIDFGDNKRFLVEIKPSSETKPPKKPQKITPKSEKNYRKAVQTWLVNSAKWESAKKFCKEHNMEFVILTEKVLK